VNLFQMSRRVIEALPKCRVLSRYGVGFDNVDVGAATERRIWVARVPDYSIEDVSDQALALLLACVRGVAYKDRGVRQGRWNMQKDVPTRRIAGKVLGLVGYGAIARCLHRKVSGLGLSRVLVHDPYVEADAVHDAGAEPVDLESLAVEADFISVHVPLGPQTRGMISEPVLRRMKPTAILVNTSRGPVIDERALAEALAAQRIAGAGLDVFETEPLDRANPLLRLENVVLSDHTGWYSQESVPELKTKAARNVAAVLSGGKPVYPVNAIESQATPR
jgi:D-3-phosphoglycerate dehydrogenase